MKKIGILTFHRALNYGAVLQCYALQEILKSLGASPVVIDYRQHEIERQHSMRLLVRPRRFIENISRFKFAKHFTEIRNTVRNRRMFNRFVAEHLRVTGTCTGSKSIPQDIGLYVVGSDQLWNTDLTGYKFDDVYIGNFPHKETSKIITYAISANSKSLKGKDEALKSFAPNFAEISIREATLGKIFEEETGFPTRSDIDPTLLTTAATWTDMTNDKYGNRKYVLVYGVRGNVGMLINMANRIAEKNGWEVIKIGSSFSVDEMESVEDFLSLFKDAQLVLTSSFHGTAMSLIFHKTFYSFALGDGGDARYVDILNTVGLSDRIKRIDEDEFEVTSVDYTEADKKWDELRQRSLQFLASHIMQ